MQELGRRTFRCPPKDNNIQSQVGLRRLKRSRIVPSPSLRCTRLPSASARSPGPPLQEPRSRVPLAEASAAPRRARTRETGRLTLDDSGPPGPRPSGSRPAVTPPRVPGAAGRGPPLPSAAFLAARARGLGGFARRRRKRTERRAVADVVQHGPRGLRSLTRASQSDASSAEVFHVDRSLASHKMGTGSGRRRIHGRRHFVRRGGARLCVMVEESDPPLGNPRR